MTRIIGRDRKDVVARNGGGWTVAAVVRQMRTALEKRGKTAPAWLKLLESESASRLRGVEPAVFGMT